MKNNTDVFKKISELINKSFQKVSFNKECLSWSAKTKSNGWDCPKSLDNFNETINKLGFYSFIAGSSWDDDGNIEISLRDRHFI